jgi:hypothetical protein
MDEGADRRALADRSAVGSITAEGWMPGAMTGPGSIAAVTPAMA